MPLVTNTVPAGVLQDAILNQVLLGFRATALPIRAFAHKFEAQLQGSGKVQVPYFDPITTASATRAAGGSFMALAQNTAFTTKEVTLNKNKTQVLSWTSEQKADVPLLGEALMQHGFDVGRKLAMDVMLDIMSAITIANFPAQYTQEPANFTSQDLRDLRPYLNRDLLMPMEERSLIIGSDYNNGLVSDTVSLEYGQVNNPRIFEEAMIPRVAGFNVFEYDQIPHNSQDLAGFVVQKNALLVGFAPKPIDPIVAACGGRNRIVTDEKSDLVLEFYEFADLNTQQPVQAVYCNYGYAKGITNALVRIVNDSPGSGDAYEYND